MQHAVDPRLTTTTPFRVFCVVLLALLWGLPQAQGGLPEDVEQAIATCDRARIRSFLDTVTDPDLQGKLLVAHVLCLREAIATACQEDAVTDLLDLDGEVSGSPYLSADVAGELNALISLCVWQHVEERAPGAIERGDLDELAVLYVLALAYVPEGEGTTARLAQAICEAWLARLRAEAFYCDPGLFSDLLQRATSDAFPVACQDEAIAQLSEAVRVCIDRLLRALERDPWGPYWEQQLALLLEYLGGDLQDIGEGQWPRIWQRLSHIMTRHYSAAIRRSSCDPEALNTLRQRMEQRRDLLQDPDYRALLRALDRKARECSRPARRQR